MDRTIRAAAHEINLALGDILGAEVVSDYVGGRQVGLHLTKALGHLLIAPEVATEEETGGMLAEVANKASRETKQAALAFLSGLPGNGANHPSVTGDPFEKAIHAMLEESLRLTQYRPGDHYPDDRGTQYHQLPEEGRIFYRRLARSLVEYLQDGIREEV